MFIQCSQASRPPCRHLQDSGLGRPGRLSQAVGQKSVLWERLPSKRVTVGPYSPLYMGNPRTVPHPSSAALPLPAVLTRICSHHPSSAVLANYLEGPPVARWARPSSGVTQKIAPPKTPTEPASPSREVIWTDAKIPVRSFRSRIRTDWALGFAVCITEYALLSNFLTKRRCKIPRSLHGYTACGASAPLFPPEGLSG